MGNILDISDAIKPYTFYFREGDKEKYFCKCGEHFEVDAPKDEDLGDDIMADDDLMQVINSAKISLRENIKCPHCNTDYKIPENQKRLKEAGKDFMSGYHIKNESDRLTLELIKVTPIKDGDEISYMESGRYISYEKENNKLFFKDYESEEVEFDLDEVIKYVDKFFNIETSVIINLMDLHNYITELSSHVSDSKNIDIIKGLLEQTRSRITEKGNDTFRKVFTILLSIIKYSNLSTIAMTKSPIFLYEMLKECNPPKAEELENAGVTSPIKIFNFLAKNYINRVNEEVSEEKITEKEFIFSSNVTLEDHEDHSKKKAGDDYEEVDKDTMTVSKGETRELKINVKNIADYESKVSKTDHGDIDVFQVEGDGQISKFIYKRLQKFHDYKQLIKYMKHLEYKQLVELMTKYDYDLIVNMIDMLYHRVDIDMDEIKRLVPLFEDHCAVRTKEIKVKTNTYNKDEEIIPEYKHVKGFNFEYYDDCRMMLETLEFDPRKDFYKIKSNAVLKVFHDEVAKYYAAIQQEEEGGYKGYFNQFNYLTSTEKYDGDLMFQLIDTPKALVAEGRDMHHSAGSYTNRLLQGNYVFLKVFDTTEDVPEGELVRFTLGLHFKQGGLIFDQLKGVTNKPASNRVRQMVLDWMLLQEIEVNERRPDIRIRR